ncbi:MAG: peptide/nickel transport system permease protein [Chlamydiales bacterium]
MFAFIVRRLLLMIPTTLGIALVVFALYHAAPGDPATVMIGMGSSEMEGHADRDARIAAFRIQHGLDRSLLVQFLAYIGPFNLLRDGYPWFSSPYAERRLSTVQLDDGTRVVEGLPMPIAAFGATEAEQATRLARLTRALRRGDGDAQAQRGSLLAAGTDSLPPLLSELHGLLVDPEGYVAGIQAISDVLCELTGHELDLPQQHLAAEGPAATVRAWFGWYYSEGGGQRVRNSGERPWAGLLALDLGREMQRKTPVFPELLRRLRVSVPLSLVAVVLSYLVALPLGIFSVRRRGTRLDGLATVFLFVLYSIPTFWAGLMLILAFGVTGPDWWWWPRLPVLGLHHKDAALMGTVDYVIDTALHAILPVVTLTYASFAYLSRQVRAGLLDVIGQDYIRTARAKGVSEHVVVYKHALRNALIPVITLFASVLPLLIGGSIIVETVFDVQGMGKYAFEGLLRRDYYIIMATTIMVGVMTQFGILISDVAYAIADPRIQHD